MGLIEDELRQSYNIFLNRAEKHEVALHPGPKALIENNQTRDGVKHDQGKPRVALMETAFARALMAVAEVATFGAEKYSDYGWLTVPDAFNRYSDAQGRHRLNRLAGQLTDEESGKLHLAHEAWNALAVLELYLRKGGE